MTLLGIAECRHFLRPAPISQSLPNVSFRNWANSVALNHSFIEGTPGYDELCQRSRREIDRLLFLGASHYRRSFDLMMPSSASWAHVTLYYGSFYTAHALLGMFGAWMMSKKRILTVGDGRPGTQRFSIANSPHATGGSHENFWNHFYHTMVSLLPLLDANIRFALEPVSNDNHWLTSSRNKINYDSHVAIDLGVQHQKHFRRTALRATLPGPIGTQFSVLEGMLTIASGFAREFRLKSDALDSFEPPSTRPKRVSRLIFGPQRQTLGTQARRRCAW